MLSIPHKDRKGHGVLKSVVQCTAYRKIELHYLSWQPLPIRRRGRRRVVKVVIIGFRSGQCHGTSPPTHETCVCMSSSLTLQGRDSKLRTRWWLSLVLNC